MSVTDVPQMQYQDSKRLTISFLLPTGCLGLIECYFRSWPPPAHFPARLLSNRNIEIQAAVTDPSDHMAPAGMIPLGLLCRFLTSRVGV